MIPKPTTKMDAKHAAMLAAATKITTPLVTYAERGGLGVPLSRGTGFFLKHGPRHFVITNTHVLERYALAHSQKKDVRVQVWAGEGEAGSEFHGRKLIVPDNKVTEELGVFSKYDHQDVGIVELTNEAVARAARSRQFVDFEDLNTDVPKPGDDVYYKGYPKKSADFDGNLKASFFGQWLDVRRVKDSSDRLIICHPAVAVYRSEGFRDEDGKDLEGISGSALVEAKENTVVGVVWGGKDGSVESAVYACPSKTIRRLVLEFDRQMDSAGN